MILMQIQASVFNSWHLIISVLDNLTDLLKAGHKTVCVTVDRGSGWGGRGLKGRLRGALSGGEIQRLRRLRHEAHTPSVLVGVSD